MRRRLSWQEAVPRVLADFLMIHSSMIGAIAVSVIYQEATGSRDQAQRLIADFERYYAQFFWLLSPIFPMTFAVFGFYTHTRSYSGRRKNWAILQGVTLGALLFLGANSLVRDSSVGRSVAVSFVVLASASLCLSRVVKNYLANRFEVRPLDSSASRRTKQSVLVVGGAGYIGSLLTERLLQLGYKVRVLDALLYGREPLRAVDRHPDFELMVGDCRNIRDVVSAVKDMDAIVDLAAI